MQRKNLITSSIDKCYYNTLFFSTDNLVFRLSIFILRELIISSSPATESLNKSNNKIIEQSSKGKGKTHKSTNRQNQSITGKLGKPQWP
jgi:hypothetical protein